MFSLYGSGKTTGLVVDSGYSTTSVVPIVDGYCHNYAHLVSHDGSIDLNNRIEILLKQKYPTLNLDQDILEEIKLNRIRVRNAGEKYSSANQGTPGYEITYDLPDGNQVKMNQSDLTLPYEKVFRNYVRGEESEYFNLFFQNTDSNQMTEPSLVSMIIESLEKIPIQHKRDLISNLILAGGNTKASNFAERLTQEVNNIPINSNLILGQFQCQKRAHC